jgi:hypothetical protein
MNPPESQKHRVHQVTGPQVQNYKDLIFPFQNVDRIFSDRVYDNIKHIDRNLESGMDLSHLRSDEQPIFSKLTMLFGPWVCNFQCPNYCYTRNFKTRSLTHDQTISIISESVKLGAKFTYWPGVGEISLLKDFWDIMNWQNSIGVPAIVFTNGSVFVDDSLCQRFLRISSSELIDRCINLKRLHFYVKFWSSDPEKASQMTGVRSEESYPYSEYLGIRCPKAFATLHKQLGNRIGLQCMVTRSTYTDYVNNILPFCVENHIHLFAEPIILSGNAKHNPEASSELLSHDQYQSIRSTFSSGEGYCNRRQYGEGVVVGDRLSPGIAIEPRSEDCLVNHDGTIKTLVNIFFNSYFREMRKRSDQINGCLCRSVTLAPSFTNK